MDLSLFLLPGRPQGSNISVVTFINIQEFISIAAKWLFSLEL